MVLFLNEALYLSSFVFRFRRDGSRKWNGTVKSLRLVYPLFNGIPKISQCSFRGFTICHAPTQIRSEGDKTSTVFLAQCVDNHWITTINHGFLHF